MPLSSAFQLALEIYDLDRDPIAARHRIWGILRPRMDAIATCYIERLSTHTPFYRNLVTNKNTVLRQHICRFTQALFEKPFDENWVADTKERVEEEIRLGLDMRNRCVLGQFILAELCKQLSKRYRFPRVNGLQLIEVAIRVLLLDATNAVALHYNAAVREAKGRSNALNSAIECFSQAFESVRHAMASAVTALSESSGRLAALADKAAEDAGKAAAAADNTASTIDQMAAATEEMTASIAEIRRQATAGADMAHEAVGNAERANATIHSLSEGVGKIGSVTGLISSIADQTNLLALNATIEAARAGQVGKGFAVVATEVKSLATQTSGATQEIGTQIASIEEATHHSVRQIAGIGRAVDTIAGMTKTVATAVNEQAAATDSIARGITDAAGNAGTVALALNAVAETIRQTQELAVSVLDASHQLSARAREVDAAVDSLFQAASIQGDFARIADLKQITSSD